MTPLRQRMLEDMQIRNLAPSTQRAYVEHVSRFARHFGRSPALLGPEDIRAYLVYLTTERHLAPSTVIIAVAALRFLYTVTLQKPWSVEAVIPAPKTPQPLPVVLSPAEVVQFLDCVAALKHRTILTTCYAAGLRISEAVRLTPSAIDSQRMVLRIAQGKGQKDRYVTAVPDAPPDAARLVAGESIPPLALSGGSPWRPHHHPCGEPRLPDGPSVLWHFQTDYAAFPAPCVCGPSPGSWHRRPHDSIAARPSQSRDHGRISGDRQDAGVRIGQPPGSAPAPRRRAVGAPVAHGPLIAESMDRPTLTVADVFRRDGDTYRDHAAPALPMAHRRVMTAIETCRTAALGGHVEQCDRCGHARVWYNSCRNRHCPTCQSLAARRLDRRPHGGPARHRVFPRRLHRAPGHCRDRRPE
jgi:hypothetical protein